MIKGNSEVQEMYYQSRPRADIPFIPLTSLIVMCIVFGRVYNTDEEIRTPFWLWALTIFTTGTIYCYISKVLRACDVSQSSLETTSMETVGPKSNYSWFDNAWTTIKAWTNLTSTPYQQHERGIASNYNDCQMKSREKDILSAKLNQYYHDPTDDRHWRILERRSFNTKVDVGDIVASQKNEDPCHPTSIKNEVTIKEECTTEILLAAIASAVATVCVISMYFFHRETSEIILEFLVNPFKRMINKVVGPQSFWDRFFTYFRQI
jgi:hypothetical protein